MLTAAKVAVPQTDPAFRRAIQSRDGSATCAATNRSLTTRLAETQ